MGQLLTLQATGAEVVFGFTFYLLCVLALGTTVGGHLQPWVKYHFGIDPGQFNALGFVSSLLSVAISFSVFLLMKIPGTSATAAATERRNEIVNDITAKKTGTDPESLPKVQE